MIKKDFKRMSLGKTNKPKIHQGYIGLINKRTFILGSVLGFLFTFFFLFRSFTYLTSTAADNLIRPMLGEEGTLKLESIYFLVNDKVNNVRYALLGQSLPSYAAATIPKNPHLKKVSSISFESLSIDYSLPPLVGEGQWVPINQSTDPDKEIMARTFIRPDPGKPYALATIVKMDMQFLGLGTEAGTYYPGGAHHLFGPGVVPKSVQLSNKLIAAFNGGFQEQDGHYGMIVGNRTYVPLRIGIPALVMFQDGSFKLIDYNGQALPTNAASIRQNGPYLVQNGVIGNYIEQGKDTWGRTITNSMSTWRSGLGISRGGNLIYAAGSSLTPKTLAIALKKAGAWNAIQLDINPPWVRFILYQSIGNGQYTNVPLITDMHGGKAYLHGYNKDFFYVYKK